MPVSGYQLEIRDDLGNRLPDAQVGRIVVKGPSLMDGYHGDPDGTEAVMEPDGWMDTGDLGYLSDGQLVVTGRQKDLIILNGRNIWPQDIELAVAGLDRIRVSDVACFSVPVPSGGERMIVVSHCRVAAPQERETLRKSILATVHKAIGADCEIVLVSPGTLPFTSSGKLSRAAVRADYLEGNLTDILQAPVPPISAEEALSVAAG